MLALGLQKAAWATIPPNTSFAPVSGKGDAGVQRSCSVNSSNDASRSCIATATMLQMWFVLEPFENGLKAQS